ncbi:MAG: ribose 5-phosphate isomerase B [Planctomycetota bacterium]|nr:ribose 5-phosphate isomerase B [Planctomycetota bacterium]
MKAIIGSDHAGINGRKEAVEVLRSRGWDIEEKGPETAEESADYPDVAHLIATAVTTGEAQLGVLVCGTGQGMAMTANRYAGARAAVITDAFTAEMSRAHNDANIACFGERVIGQEQIAAHLQTFLDTPFEGGRHEGRVGKIDNIIKEA